jgi:hypothetical protein
LVAAAVDPNARAATATIEIHMDRFIRDSFSELSTSQ